MVGKMVPVPCKSNGKEKEFEYYFLRNCRNWNLVKKKISESFANRKFIKNL
jgi:hypothetical protein